MQNPFTRLLPATAWAVLEPELSPRTFARDAFLLRAGDRAELVHFVVQGLVRELYVGLDGAQHTRVFVAEGEATGSLLDLLSGEPAVTFIQALEPTQTLALSYRTFLQLCDRHPALERLARHTAEALYVRKAKRERDMLTLTGAERLAQWLAEHGSLDPRIRRTHLASYLGMTPEHLSRLRRR